LSGRILNVTALNYAKKNFGIAGTKMEPYRHSKDLKKMDLDSLRKLEAVILAIL